MKKEEQGEKLSQGKELSGLLGKKTTNAPGVIPKPTELSDEDCDKVAGGEIGTIDDVPAATLLKIRKLNIK